MSLASSITKGGTHHTGPDLEPAYPCLSFVAVTALRSSTQAPVLHHPAPCHGHTRQTVAAPEQRQTGFLSLTVAGTTTDLFDR